MLYRWADLTEEQLARIKAYEAKTGKTALALTKLDVEPAELSQEEELELYALERETGAVIVVIK